MSDELQHLRDRLDQIDAILVHTLAERFRHTDRVGELKARNGLPALDETREREQRDRLATLATEAGIDPDLFLDIHGKIIDLAKENHRKISGEQ